MPGNYSITTLVDGQIYSAADHNTAHQNHVNNMTPAGGDDYSPDVTTMRLKTDPGEVGTESLATSLAGELERMRFILAEMKDTTQWYETNKVREEILPFIMLDASNVPIRNRMDDGVSTTCRSFWQVRPNKVGSTTVTFFMSHFQGIGTGTMVISFTITRYREGVAALVLATGTNNIVAPGTNLVRQAYSTVTDSGGTNFNVNDIIVCDYTRLGADAGDTATGNLTIVGPTVNFTAFGGRP